MAADSPVEYSDAQQQHLAFIQAVIGRMSSASGVTKGWSLTIATATYGYAGTAPSALVASLGIFAILVFASVDARYLREERKFRLLFDAAREGKVSAYEMNARVLCSNLPPGERKAISWSRVVWSWSVRDFYGLILLVGAALLAWILLR